MARNRKTRFRVYSAWNYGKEIEDLNALSEQGWQLIRGGLFHSTFEKNPTVRYRYQMDFRKVENLPLYLDTFREQGWEYINSTFNGWHYFRRLRDPALPEEAYEIYTDRESLRAMNLRWARLALGIGIALGLLAILSLVSLIRQPTLPDLVRFLTFAVECTVLLRGFFLMRDPEESRSRRGDSALLAVFLAIMVLGAAGSIALSALRPRFVSEQQAGSVEEPFTQEWMDFDVRYPDRYWLDLSLSADRPASVEITDGEGKPVFSVTDTALEKETFALKLPRGRYFLLLSAESGFHAAVSLR